MRTLRPAALLMMALATPAWAGGPAERPVVVELFTSQGCNSCPPADALLGKLAVRPGVLAMSLPVTYWDMLGWKDTLASQTNTNRQKSYAAQMGLGGVYTPQMIVDGTADVVGSRADAVEQAIVQRRGAAAHAIPVSVTEGPEAMSVVIGAGPDSRPATVWLFHMRTAVSVPVGAGENAGHTITYRNVVADVRPVGMWNGHAATLTVPRAALTGLAHDAVAVVMQQDGYGQVIGAAAVSHPSYDAAR